MKNHIINLLLKFTIWLLYKKLQYKTKRNIVIIEVPMFLYDNIEYEAENKYFDVIDMIQTMKIQDHDRYPDVERLAVETVKDALVHELKRVVDIKTYHDNMCGKYIKGSIRFCKERK